MNKYLVAINFLSMLKRALGFLLRAELSRKNNPNLTATGLYYLPQRVRVPEYRLGHRTWVNVQNVIMTKVDQ
jgi:hypothetical protein